METDDAELYVVRTREGDGAEWVRPASVEEAVVDALTETTALTAGDIGPLGTYVDAADLRSVLRATGGTVTFPVEEYEVTVHSSGRVTVR
ncbi:HalOD1 output domain-containing protein [Salinirussus salinus]|jgi:hypothetical protein|uniref:HalOD1 output domain-containing protein n=1 Tax=Salinirussus salinus TaxID=1198300 RepID=UPI001356E170|nr:HalOD1 output domain-containing protein [Salinirussus salinus]